MTSLEPNPTSRTKRPLAITLAGLIFLILSVAGWARLVWTIQSWDLLVELGVEPSTTYIAAGGALWGVLGLPVALGLWTRRRWAPLGAVIAGLVYVFTYWFDRFVIAQSGVPSPNNPFALVVSLLGMGFLLAVLTSRSSKRYFNQEPK